MVAKRKRLFLIDGYSNIFRAFYAIRSLTNSQGQPTNAVYGFVQMLRELVRDEEPELVGVALDVSRRTIRTEKYEAYKTHRDPMPEELREQMPWLRQAIEAFRIPILELENYEADDVLGSLAKKASQAGLDVVLVSADKDLMQLVSEHVSLLHTGRNKLYDPAGVEADFGVRPEQVTEVLALQGDASDNVPGVPGIGQKGAVQLVREHGSLQNLLDKADEIKRKSYREGLQQHREQALLSKELVTIHTDLPIEFDPEELSLEPPDPQALKKLYRELEFFSLLEELEKSNASEVEIPAAKPVTTVEAWQQASAEMPDRLCVALVGEGTPIGLAVAAAGRPPALADFAAPDLAAAALESLTGWLGDPEREVLGHDLKEVLRWAHLRQVDARLLDTMLISYVLQPSLRAHSLEEVSLERLGYRALSAKEAGLEVGEGASPSDQTVLLFAGERVELPQRLLPMMEGELGEGALADVYHQIEAPLVPVLLGMEETGVQLDTDFLAQMSEELRTELEQLEAEIYELAGEEFNINSPRQLGVILFEKLGYPVLKKTRKTKNYSTSAEILQQLADQGYPLPELLLRYRELSKLKSTYVDALAELVADDGRIHTRFQQAVAATGRLSSINPNLQNIPVRTAKGQRIRKAFVAPSGRVLRSTAASVFGVAPELVTAEQRRAAKAINFGIIYGISGFGLARNLGIRPGEAEVFIRAYFEQYPGVKRYMEETLAAAEAAGKVETLYGRVRYLPEIRSKNRNLRENARRMAINARIQGTAADLLKKAMITLDGALRSRHPNSLLLLTVHDELVLEVPEKDVDSVSELTQEIMEGVERLRVPLVVDLGSGPSWFEAKV
jgi:DNA polymerase-1